MDGSKPKPQKQLSQPAMGKCEVDGGRLRGSQSSEGSDLISNIPPYSPISDTAFRDIDCSEY